METVLSTVVFVYAVKAATEETCELADFSRNMLRLGVAMGAACGIWTGISCVFTVRVQQTVSNIVSMNRREINRLGHNGQAGSPDLRGVNLFEYHDVVTIGLNVTVVVSISLLCFFFWVVVCVLFALCMLLVPWNIFHSPPPEFWFAFCALFVVWLGCYSRLIYKWGIVGTFRNFREACCTRPSCGNVKALLLGSSLLYAVLLNLSPLPALWCWSLITTHTARAITVYVLLKDQFGVEAAHGELSGDML